jgi:hypothetical protein
VTVPQRLTAQGNVGFKAGVIVRRPKPGQRLALVEVKLLYQSR